MNPKSPYIAFLAITLLASSNLCSQTARIKIDAERVIGDIDPLLYGNFTEHLGRCIYGGIYDPKSSQSDDNGLRKDVAEATRKLGVSVVRYPGGNFTSGYHWLDGVGPKSDRPKRKDLAWGDIEPNLVGTDEFMQFSRLTGTQPYLCVNMGTGTLDEARNWVEYCNAPTGLYYSDLRAKYGHPEPYKVKFWGLGNEMDGEWQMGHKNAEDYSKFALEAAKLMKWSDDSIKLIVSGSSNYNDRWMDWNRMVLTTLRDHADYISLHHYSGNYDKDHNKFMAVTTRVDNIITTTEAMINEIRSRYKIDHPIFIAFDEYNVWYRAGNEQKLEEHYNMQDALVVAMYLNTFIRHANIVKMANMAQLVNVIAPMMVTNDKLWLQTIYHPLQLFANRCKGRSLETFVQGDTYDAGDYKKVPWLDVSTVYNPATKEIILNVVNRNADKSVATTIENQYGNLGNSANITEVNSTSIMDENSVNEQKVKPTEKTISVKGNTLSYNFPPHSFTQMVIKTNF